jgi:hypothetical protein
LESLFVSGIAWGDVRWRDRMVISTQDVYRRLLLGTPSSESLSFDILARTAMGTDGSLDQEKLKHLIRLFRPDRDGKMTLYYNKVKEIFSSMLTSCFSGKLNLLQFVKSVDTVYKEAKLLRASVRNSEKIDRAFERAANVLFYVIVICVTLSRLGYDPLAMFLSLSSILLAFAFMIGTASSKMFEGFLFILIRRPVSEITSFHLNFNNSPSFFVFQCTLFTASVQYW